ncbi:MAG TPA: hypothetical protein VIA06_00130 [Candidatus Dormibacteraeota bacterium]|nr:hypothetical protein [Candidatus Dormibacteraeota bacterium]
MSSETTPVRYVFRTFVPENLDARLREIGGRLVRADDGYAHPTDQHGNPRSNNYLAEVPADRLQPLLLELSTPRAWKEYGTPLGTPEGLAAERAESEQRLGLREL